MKITQLTLTEKASEDRDYYDVLAIQIDEKRVFEVFDGEIEDNNLGRNFGDCYKIMGLLETVYKVGLRKEKIEFIFKQVEEI